MAALELKIICVVYSAELDRLLCDILEVFQVIKSSCAVNFGKIFGNWFY